MKAVVSYGTASAALKDMPFPVAGKTGTAKKVKYGEYRNVYRASFGGFFPANDPKYTCYVMVDEPIAGGYGGGAIAAPIFRQISQQVYNMDTRLSNPETPEEMEEPEGFPKAPIMYADAAKRLYEAFEVEVPIMPDTTWVAVKSDSSKIQFEKIVSEASVIPDLRGKCPRNLSLRCP